MFRSHECQAIIRRPSPKMSFSAGMPGVPAVKYCPWLQRQDSLIFLLGIAKLQAAVIKTKSISTTEYRVTGLGGPRIELGTEREGLLQMLDEDAYFGRDPAACRPNGQDWHCSLKGGQQTYDSTFPEFCGEEPCWRLGNPEMLKNSHHHLLDIAGSEDSCGDNSLCVLAGPDAPWLCGPTLDKNNRWKAAEIFR